MAAAIISERSPFEQADVRESGQELRDGGPRDAGSSRELGAGYALVRDRPQGEVLGDGQRGVVAGE